MPGAVPTMPGVRAPPEMAQQYRREVARLIGRGENSSFPGKASSYAGEGGREGVFRRVGTESCIFRGPASQFCKTSPGGVEEGRVGDHTLGPSSQVLTSATHAVTTSAKSPMVSGA